MWFKPARLGQVYRALEDIKILGVVILNAAGSGGFYCILPEGTKIVITNEPLRWPISRGAYAAPLNYKELEDKLVPIQERKSPIYRMYSLSVTFKDLKRYFVREDIDIKDIKFDDVQMQAYFDDRIRDRKLDHGNSRVIPER